MAGLTLTGLASGVDTDSIVQKLMDVERKGLTRIQNRQTSVTAHQTALKAVTDKLNALSTAASALTDPTTWKTAQTTVSSDPTKVGVAQIGGAGIGGHTIAVDRLASSAQHGFAYVPNATGGSFTVTSGTTTATISVAANATAKDVATAINASTTAPVYAAVIKDGSGAERVVLSSRKTGQSNDFTVDATALAPGQLTEDAALSRTGTVLNAQYRIDGEVAPRSSETNAIENAIPGLRLTLAGVTTSPVSITTSEAAIDKSAIKGKVKAFVDAYNAVVDLARTDISQKGVRNASTPEDLAKGTLFGDLGLNSMLSSLKRTFTQSVAGIGDLSSLSQVGIAAPKSTGVVTEDAKAGKLTFDEKALDAALDKDWTQVNKLFNGVGAKKGFSLLVGDFVKAQTGVNGVITGRIESDSSSLTDLGKQVTATNARLDQTEARLKAQFAAMEKALQNSQSQQSWLQGQISALNK
jgi:flagellar hook-associated protein 2